MKVNALTGYVLGMIGLCVKNNMQWSGQVIFRNTQKFHLGQKSLAVCF